MNHVPRRASSFSGQLPVKLEGAPNGPLAGVCLLRGVRVFSHDHLCRVFGLDPAFYFFELPSSIRGVGASSVGAGGGDRAGRVINGYVCYARFEKPVGKLTVLQDVRTGLRDDDPTNERDFFDLNRT